MNRVVVTGLGAICPVGNTAEDAWKALLAGKSGIDYISTFDVSSFPVKVAGEVRGFDPQTHMDRKVARRSGRFSQFALVAATEALQSARLEVTEANRDGIGAIVATSGGGFDTGPAYVTLQERGPNRVDPVLIMRVGGHMAGVRVGRELGIRGPNSTVNSACASGNDAIGQALNMLRLGHAQAILAGGAEAALNGVGLAALANVGALSRSERPPQEVCRPFDAERDGFVMAEGAGILLLETEEHARERGAPIICELAGAGWSFDATDETAPDAEGQALAMRRAMADASVGPEDVSYVNAHGTSTQLNDAAETRALKLALGEAAAATPISSIKSMAGHLAAGAGGLESVMSVFAIRDGMVPPTINYEHPDPACDLDYVPNVARKVDVEAVLTNSFGLGGQNCCLVFRRYR
ncbi:MAG TPA: beta-ketoacyl-ACP synthase II [Dehalococcoidia bacterium]|nr:beta-ketoacyl-ACP synthase II [Dehalococcoidia bacterium]